MPRNRTISKEEFLEALDKATSVKHLCEILGRSKPSLYTYAYEYRIPLKRRWVTKDYVREDGYFHYDNPKNHRRIAEKAIGRPLKRNECVHHIDGDKSNNDHSNLLVCTVSYHSQLHHKMSELYAKMMFGKKI